jgi:hypothetical protein
MALFNPLRFGGPPLSKHPLVTVLVRGDLIAYSTLLTSQGATGYEIRTEAALDWRAHAEDRVGTHSEVRPARVRWQGETQDALKGHPHETLRRRMFVTLLEMVKGALFRDHEPDAEIVTCLQLFADGLLRLLIGQ